uniref:Putative histone acetyltransferase pcaf/saga subunit supt3h/spt3 rhodnius neglectus n=2 Tax=Rhodnius TaxID=13248 RepID=A0A4P6DFV2_RHOPR
MASTSVTSKDELTQGKNISFVKDIQMMMFGLGDCPDPLLETAQLIEIIVLEQMISLLYQAKEVADLRGAPAVGPEDVLFLMRNNISALKRLISYLGLKDGKNALNKIMASEEVPDLPPTLLPASQTEQVEPENELSMELDLNEEVKGKPLVTWKKSRKGYCLQFLEKIGIEEEDLEGVEDEVKEERLSRANSVTMNLSSKAYEEYHMSRCASFANNQMSAKRFVDWLKYIGRYRDEICGPLLEILVYIAKETIAILIDMVLTLREEANQEPMIQPPPISPDEIREVVRRCVSQQSIPMSLFSRDVMPTINKKLIAI